MLILDKRSAAPCIHYIDSYPQSKQIQAFSACFRVLMHACAKSIYNLLCVMISIIKNNFIILFI